MVEKLLKKTFTLVELIIVVAIMLILATLTFLIITKWLSVSRDGSRASSLANLEKSLLLYSMAKSTLPVPEDNISIMFSGNIIGYQGIFGENNKNQVGNISATPKDPDLGEYYTYYIDSSKKYFQLLGFAENKTSLNSYKANADSYSKRYHILKGHSLGVFVDSDNTPINLDGSLTGLDVLITTGVYTALFSDTQYLQGTGQLLQWLLSNINNGGAGYNSPSNCPEGFIPVPGNKDFNQPGFCVAKYEMKQIDGTAGSFLNSVRSPSPSEYCGNGGIGSKSPCNNDIDPVDTIDKKIESKPEGMPIARINQATAIRACSQMGSGYHLITNKEWMTIARNIEQQGINRTGGKVGVGGIYRGQNLINNTSFLSTGGNSNPYSIDCEGGQTYTGADNILSRASFGTSKACDITVNGLTRSKKALMLSNSQRIRDFAGNLREHVNKADTIDGTGYLTGLDGYIDQKFKIDIADNYPISGAGDQQYYYWHKFGRANISSSEKLKNGPLGAYGTGQGMGNIIGWRLSDTLYSSNIFLRGGDGLSSINAGIYTILLTRKGESGDVAGFRCAR